MELRILPNSIIPSGVLTLAALSCVQMEMSSMEKCRPLLANEAIIPECIYSTDASNSSGDTFCTVRLRLADGFKGSMTLDRLALRLGTIKIQAESPDTVITLFPMLDREKRICQLVSEIPLRKDEGFIMHIPEGLVKAVPDFTEVDEIDIEEDLLSNLSVAGAWHKPGGEWTQAAMFSVIDDDSLDGQIKSSKHSRYTYGYWSLLYPLLESLGLKGNLAVEGRKIGIDYDPPYLNDNGKTLIRLQDEKGWSLLCHSMECLGENRDNWLVDSLDSPLARRIFEDGPNYGLHGRTVSVYDLKTLKQYWPNADNSVWEETPSRYVKPYVADYDSQKDLFYNPDYDIDWHWGEWKKRAESFGINAVGFVTHNSTSSHSLVPEIRKVFEYGLSDIGSININFPMMLSSGVRAGLEGQSLAHYDGNSTDNTFNDDHFRKFCSQVDETREKKGWIIFNLHTYREVWDNSLPGALVSEGGSYPDEWVIPMKGMDSANDPLSPPAHLGISDWSEWYPCPGTRLEMMWKVLKYAKEKGLRNVTCAEGFELMGNRKNSGYYNRGYRFGKDYWGLIDTEEVYPHYVVSATGEVSYFKPILSEEYLLDLNDVGSMECMQSDSMGRFFVSEGRVMWNCANPSLISLEVRDLTGSILATSSSNCMVLDGNLHGVLLICAVRSGAVVGSIKLTR